MAAGVGSSVCVFCLRALVLTRRFSRVRGATHGGTALLEGGLLRSVSSSAQIGAPALAAGWPVTAANRESVCVVREGALSFLLCFRPRRTQVRCGRALRANEWWCQVRVLWRWAFEGLLDARSVWQQLPNWTRTRTHAPFAMRQTETKREKRRRLARQGPDKLRRCRAGDSPATNKRRHCGVVVSPSLRWVLVLVLLSFC